MREVELNWEDHRRRLRWSALYSLGFKGPTSIPVFFIYLIYSSALLPTTLSDPVLKIRINSHKRVPCPTRTDYRGLYTNSGLRGVPQSLKTHFFFCADSYFENLLRKSKKKISICCVFQTYMGSWFSNNSLHPPRALKHTIHCEFELIRAKRVAAPPQIRVFWGIWESKKYLRSSW